MSIQKLPQESVRSIGSAQVITTPLTVFKELVENALDAKATTVSLESAPDLLSYLVVKDNGTGIPHDDRPLMAAPHCTSKIQNYEDIAEVATLGFRGEALASLAAISGNLTIATRTEKETVGVACDVGKDGKISRQSTIPMPRGTTVKVANLFVNVPVRKASIEKTAAKILPQIRPLLVSYVLTHPNVRFSFKLVAPPTGHSSKKKIDTKYDVVFSSSKSVEDAFLKSVGKDAAGSGIWLHEVPSGANDQALEFRAFLVRPDADTDSVSKKGTFISFQQRPLSIERKGFAKQAYAMYKKYVKNCTLHNLHGVSEPFLYLDITANRNTVDVNIEPAKDDVLFIHNDVVLTALGEFFTRVYGQLAEETTKDTATRTPLKVKGSRDVDDFNVLLSGRNRGTTISDVHHVAQDISPTRIDESAQNNNVELRPTTDTDGSEMLFVDKYKAPSVFREGDEDMVSSDVSNKTTSTQSRWKFNMYDSELPPDDDNTSQGEREVSARRIDTETEELDDEPEVDTIETSNPFTIAKMNSRIQTTTPIAKTNSQNVPRDQSTPTTNRVTSRAPFLTPVSSRPSPGGHSIVQDVSIDITPKTPTTAVNVYTPVSTGRGLWYPSFGSNSTNSTNNKGKRKNHVTMNQTLPINEWLVKGTSNDSYKSTNDTIQTSTEFPATPFSETEYSQMENSRAITGLPTFKSAKEVDRRDVEQHPIDVISSDEDVTSQLQPKVRRENRQKAITDGIIENRDNIRSTNSPYKNRQNAARAALSSTTENEDPIQDKTKKRFRAPVLSLETIPTKDQLHKVRLTLPPHLDLNYINHSRYLQDPLWYNDASPILDELPDLARMIRDCLWRAKSSGLIKELLSQNDEDTSQRVPDVLQKSDAEHLKIVIEKTAEDEVAKLKVM